MQWSTNRLTVMYKLHIAYKNAYLKWICQKNGSDFRRTPKDSVINWILCKRERWRCSREKIRTAMRAELQNLFWTATCLQKWDRRGKQVQATPLKLLWLYMCTSLWTYKALILLLLSKKRTKRWHIKQTTLVERPKKWTSTYTPPPPFPLSAPKIKFTNKLQYIPTDQYQHFYNLLFFVWLYSQQ